MTEQQARAAVGSVAVVLASLIAGLAFGQTALNVVLVATALWLLWTACAVHERADETSDVADRALDGVESLKDYLHGTEGPGTGRHARRAA